MTRFSFVAAIATAILLNSCSDEEIYQPSQPQEVVTISASTEEPATKTEVDDYGQVYWSQGDRISVFTKYSNNLFTTAVSAKAATAVFTGTVSTSTQYLGLYPYSEDALSEGSTMTTTLPCEQVGTAGSFEKNLFIAVAKTTDASSMSFKNVCSGIRFKVASSGITSVEFKSNAGEALAGRFNISFSSAGLPVVGNVKDASAKVTLTAPDQGGFVPGTWYYIVTLPATLTKGFTLTYIKDGIPYSVSNSTSTVLTRSRFGSLDKADSKATMVMDADPSLYWEEEGFSNTVTVKYSGTKATVTSSTSKITYGTSGAHVWVNLGTEASGKKAEIIVSGTSSNGSLKVYGEKKLKLTLDGVTLTSGQGPAINVQDGKRMYLHLGDGTTNVLKDAVTYSDDSYYVSGASSSTEQRKACLFSEGRIVVSGTGTLSVTGNHNNAIATDDFFFMRPGPSIIASSAAGNGLKVGGIETPSDDDYDTDGDLIGCTITGGSLEISTSAVGGKAINTEGNFKMTGGTVNLSTSADAQIVTEDGTSELQGSACIKVDKDCKITGGTLVGKSTGIAGKGLNVDGNIQIGDSAGGRPVVEFSTTGGHYGKVSTNEPMDDDSDEITSSSKAIKADGTIIVYNGDLTVSTTGDNAEGMESKETSSTAIQLLGGKLKMKCCDDCINCAGGIVFGGTVVFAWSTDNDAIDSNKKSSSAITVNGGTVVAVTSGERMEEGLDCDTAPIIVNGGYVFTIGGAQGMGASSANSTTAKQNCVMLKGVDFTKGKYVSLTNSSGTSSFGFFVPFDYSNSYSFITIPDLTIGKNYYLRESSSIPRQCVDAWTCTNEEHDFSIGFYWGGLASSTKSIASFYQSYAMTTISLNN